jgi:hypothetical protein
MRNCVRAIAIFAIALAQAQCGLSVPLIPEVWDLVADSEATQHMEKQIKFAIFCELRDAVHLAREQYHQYYYQGHVVTTKEEQPVPDSWGAQLTLTFTVDQASKLNPGASLIWPLKKPAPSESFTLGAGGTLSADATRVDKYETFYTIGEIANVYSENQICNVPPQAELGPTSHSSLLVVSDLGIREWLPAAASVSGFLRSSRKDPNGVGPALGSAGSFASDSFSYDVKFVVVTDANVTPSWKLVRVTTPTSPALFDTSRTRTHELLITIGPSATQTAKNAKGLFVTRVVGPSAAASNSHLAQEIGSAVATAIRPVVTGP